MHTIVGVLRGGQSRQHSVSVETGGTILANLSEDRFVARPIFIDRTGKWYDRGRIVEPSHILQQLDAAIIGFHGEHTADVEAQRLLEQFGVPHTGSDSFASYLASHKLMAKTHAQDAGLKTPHFRYIEHLEDAEEEVQEIVRTFAQPVVVKPIGWGSAIGVSVVGGYAPILKAVQDLFLAGAEGVLVEEYIRGTTVSVGVIEDLRGEPLYALPPVESHLLQKEGAVRVGVGACPAKLSRVSAEEVGVAARTMHRALGLRHYSQSDFVVTSKGMYYLETNAFPALAPHTPMARSLAAVGVSLKEFFSHLVNLATSR